MEQETKKEVDKRNGYQEIISMEEYLDKRRKMKRNEKKRNSETNDCRFRGRSKLIAHRKSGRNLSDALHQRARCLS